MNLPCEYHRFWIRFTRGLRVAWLNTCRGLMRIPSPDYVTGTAMKPDRGEWDMAMSAQGFSREQRDLLWDWYTFGPADEAQLIDHLRRYSDEIRRH